MNIITENSSLTVLTAPEQATISSTNSVTYTRCTRCCLAKLKEYNAKQTRADRKTSNYYEHIKNDGKLKPFYEVIVQFGDVESCGLRSGIWEKAKLKRVSDLSAAYEKIVEGNYIDNLIRAQREQEQTRATEKRT